MKATPTKLSEVPITTAAELMERYDSFLLDAFGVLLSAGGAIEGANVFLQELERRHKPYLIVTNDASRLPKTCSEHYASKGIHIPEALILTSGQLIEGYFRKNGLFGAQPRCVVMGPEDSKDFVRASGGMLVEPDELGTLDVLVIGDDEGYPMLPTLDAVVSMVIRTVEDGGTPHLVLPNPDVIYPKGNRRYGVTAGGVALIIEGALEARLGEAAPRFQRLGKPYTPIFEAAFERWGRERSKTVMIGDQLLTDILGANRAGVDSVIVGTGLTPWGPNTPTRGAVPTYRCEGLLL